MICVRLRVTSARPRTNVAPFGLMATVQPGGFNLVLGHGDSLAFYEMSIMLGYRFEWSRGVSLG